jgi:hypothetical protein
MRLSKLMVIDSPIVYRGLALLISGGRFYVTTRALRSFMFTLFINHVCDSLIRINHMVTMNVFASFTKCLIVVVKRNALTIEIKLEFSCVHARYSFLNRFKCF